VDSERRSKRIKEPVEGEDEKITSQKGSKPNEEGKPTPKKKRNHTRHLSMQLGLKDLEQHKEDLAAVEIPMTARAETSATHKRVHKKKQRPTAQIDVDSLTAQVLNPEEKLKVRSRTTRESNSKKSSQDGRKSRRHHTDSRKSTKHKESDQNQDQEAPQSTNTVDSPRKPKSPRRKVGAGTATPQSSKLPKSLDPAPEINKIVVSPRKPSKARTVNHKGRKSKSTSKKSTSPDQFCKRTKVLYKYALARSPKTATTSPKQ